MTHSEEDLRAALLLLEARTPPWPIASTPPPRPPRRSRQVVIATAAGLAVAACAAGAIVGIHYAHRPATSQLSFATALNYDSFPLDQYRLSPTERDTVDGAEDTLINECAARLDIPLVLDTHVQWRDDFPFVYGASLRPLTAADAAQYGYHFRPSGEAPNDDAIARLTPDQQQQIFGADHQGGCFAAAVEELTGRPISGVIGSGLLVDDQYFVNTLLSQTVDEANSSAAVQATFPAWSTCMATAGYPGLASPRDAIMGVNYGSAPATESEITQGVADFHCKESTGLLSTWADTVYELQSQAVSDNQHQLQMIRDHLDATVARSQDVLEH